MRNRIGKRLVARAGPRFHRRWHVRAALWTAALLSAQTVAPVPAAAPVAVAALPARATLPRLHRRPNPIALRGPARPGRFLEAAGRRAAFLGREDGSLEAWVWPLKVLHDFALSFGIAAYAQPIPGHAIASEVVVAPEATTVRYAHAAFTVDATWFVPLEQGGGLILLDVDTSVVLTVRVSFRPDLKLMWPAGLGGQYSAWDGELSAYVLGEGSGRHAALVGSPLATVPPPQPAHNLPDAPLAFSIPITPEIAATGVVPIVVAASGEGFDAARHTYARLLESAAASYERTEEHYRVLRRRFASIDTPDDALDAALEWGKVALDRGFVCNPDLGCGLIAGLGPSGSSERPGFGWFFGGDAFINSWAITAYGDFATVRRSLEFLRERQREDGKMMHELSQAAAYIRWFDDYPYGYYHADTTPLYITAVRDYVRASGDRAFARENWSSVRSAFEYCRNADEDGDGLMDNTRAGLAAVETGTLRRADVLTDVFLAAAWTEAAAATAELATLAGDAQLAAAATAAHERARAALQRRFLDDAAGRIRFALLRDGTGRAEPTVWPAFGLWRGVFDVDRPAVVGALDLLAGSGVGADWGARMLSRRSGLYEPLSYNNGAVWPFLSGFAALALYEYGRPEAAFSYLAGTSALTFLGDRGFVPELLSGDRLRAIDAAVPHQLFATTGLVAAVLRGLFGVRVEQKPDAGDRLLLRLAPRLPAGWDRMSVRELRWGDARLGLALERWQGVHSDTMTARLRLRGTAVPIRLELALPPGAEVTSTDGAWPDPSAVQIVRDARGAVCVLAMASVAEGEVTLRVRHRAGVTLRPLHAPLRTGDRSRRLRVLETRYEDGVYTARLEGRAGHAYRVELDTPSPVAGVSGARAVSDDGRVHLLEVTFPDGPGAWLARTIEVRLEESAR